MKINFSNEEGEHPILKSFLFCGFCLLYTGKLIVVPFYFDGLVDKGKW
jgi:hypothetical protein